VGEAIKDNIKLHWSINNPNDPNLTEENIRGVGCLLYFEEKMERDDSFKIRILPPLDYDISNMEGSILVCFFFPIFT